MDLLNLLGERLFLDFLITTNFDFNYENSTVTLNYSSHLELSDIDYKIQSIQDQLNAAKDDENKSSEVIATLERAIQMLNDLRSKIS